MSTNRRQPDWRQQGERSTPLMLRIIVFLGTTLPRPMVRVFLYPIVAYFLMTTGSAQRASNDYLRRVLGREPALRDRWRHYFTFASVTLDRILLLGKNQRNISIAAEWSAGILPVVASGRGCLLIVAHFGSTEILRFTPHPKEVTPDPVSTVTATLDHTNQIKTTILMDRKVGRMLTELLEELDPAHSLNIIDASVRGPQLVLQMKEALDAGRIVCIMADRVADGEGSVEVELLGGPVRFAETPWILATVLQVPVILGFGIYRDSTRYSIHFELFAEKVAPTRSERAQVIAQLAQRYASRLEHYARLAPYNWFNFYDFWLHDEKVERR